VRRNLHSIAIILQFRREVTSRVKYVGLNIDRGKMRYCDHTISWSAAPAPYFYMSKNFIIHIHTHTHTRVFFQDTHFYIKTTRNSVIDPSYDNLNPQRLKRFSSRFLRYSFKCRSRRATMYSTVKYMQGTKRWFPSLRMHGGCNSIFAVCVSNSR